jgi:hypothetical protein
MVILGFGGKARSGKDTSVDMLKDRLEFKGYKVLHINMANYVKYIAKEYFDWDGQKDEKGRHILQQVGTEIVRSKNPDFWVNTVIEFIKVFDNYDFVLIGDVRFPNEINRFKEEGYQTYSVHVERLNFENNLTKEQRNHLSETSMDNFKFDYYIEAENLRQLDDEVDELVHWLYERGAV